MSRPLPSIGAILRPASPAQPSATPSSTSVVPRSTSVGHSATTSPADRLDEPGRFLADAGVSEPAVQDWSPSSAPAAESGAGETVYLVPRQVYMPRSIHAQAKAFAAVSGIPMTEMIVTALSDMHGALPAFLRQERTQTNTSVPGELYAIPQRARRKRSPDRQVQTSIRVTDQQLTVMDELAVKYGVNRSKLLSDCLQMWLIERSTQPTRT